MLVVVVRRRRRSNSRKSEANQGQKSTSKDKTTHTGHNQIISTQVFWRLHDSGCPAV